MPSPQLPHAAQPDPSFSLLLSLPRELRDRVYQFALVSRAPFWWPGKSPELATIDHRNVNVGLLRANKQVYSETMDIIYSQNKFLFTHPSDLNIFRVVTPPASVNITSVLFRIREKDLRIWTAYLGSRKEDRSLRHDLPKLRSVWVFLRCGTVSLPPGLQPVPVGAAGVGTTAMAATAGHVQATHHNLGHHMQALHHSITQVLGQGGGQAQPHNNMNHIPPPPPPPPQAPAIPFLQFAQGALGGLGGHVPHHHHHPLPPPQAEQHHAPPNLQLLAQQVHQAHVNHQLNIPPPPPPGAPPTVDPHHLYNSFLRFEREIGVESLCLNLRDVLYPGVPDPSSNYGRGKVSSTSSKSTSGSSNNNKLPTEIKIMAMFRIPRRELERLIATYPDELKVEKSTMDARTKFRKMHGVDVSLELTGYPSLVELGMEMPGVEMD
ncbi:hypothetical protein HRS9139_05023 [Pyrenophora teres f. teres]|nr:hypothetical protein HRS9139_05023 [Pyrenophora teres f. teres]KAE8864523.1 hypothetical protein PTNB29_04487 [Pyrenophora teres f. teres]